MSAIIALSPLIVITAATWVLYSAAIASVSLDMGLEMLMDDTGVDLDATDSTANKVEIPIENARVVEGSLQRNERVTVRGDGFKATFIKDPRGDCHVEVTGEKYSCEELRERGEEIVRRVNQEYAHLRVKDELKKKGFLLEKEETDEDGTIHLTVGKWQ